MYRPTIRSNLWLGLMTVAFLALQYWSETSVVTVPESNQELKLKAAGTMFEALNALTEYRLPELEARASAEIGDPLVYTMLGEKDSPITTDVGYIEEKITVLNPNLAAVVLDMLTRAGVQAGDTVAVLLTGAMPGANIALYSASRALDLHLVVITSIGSSWWGANSPDFTWLDMERVLNARGVFPYRSIAGSIGGSDDQGGLRLSDLGRRMVRDAIDRNEVVFIHQGSLSENIQARLELFRRVMPLGSYKAVVNVGGGIAALGHRENGRLIPTDVNRQLPDRNYPGLGTVHYFAEAGVPIVHLYDIRKLAHRYQLPVARLPLPEVGRGKVYSHRVYNITIAAIALALMFAILAVVKYFDRKIYRWREQRIDPDTIV